MREQNRTDKPSNDLLIRHLEEAARRVRQWPVWKQMVLNGTPLPIGESQSEVRKSEGSGRDTYDGK